MLPPLAPALAPIPALPEPPLHDVRRLSYSALALFERCSYRYYAERVAGMRPADAPRDGAGPPAWPRPRSATRCTACSSSSTWPRPSRPTLEQRARLVSGRHRRRARPHPRLRRRRTAGRSSRGGSRRWPGAGRSGRSPSSTTACCCTAASTSSTATGPRALVLDYKTNSLAEGTPEEIVEADYRLQRLVYALACFRAGAEEVEVVYHFLERPDAGRLDDVRARATARARGRALGGDRAHPGGRVPADAERVHVRRAVPALDVVCAGPRLRARCGRRLWRQRVRAGRRPLRRPRQPAGARGRAREPTSTRTRSSAAAMSRWGAMPAETLDASCATAGAPLRARQLRPRPPRRLTVRCASSSAEEVDVPRRAARSRVELDVDGLGRVLFCHATPHERRGDLHAPDARRRAGRGILADVRGGRRRLRPHARAVRPHASAAGASSTRAAWACRTRAAPARSGLLLGPDVELRAPTTTRRPPPTRSERDGTPSAAQFADYAASSRRIPRRRPRYFESARGS